MTFDPVGAGLTVACLIVFPAIGWALRISYLQSKSLDRLDRVERDVRGIGQRQTLLEHQFTVIIAALSKIEGRLDTLIATSPVRATSTDADPAPVRLGESEQGDHK